MSEITVTDAAIKRIMQQREAKGDEALMLRVEVRAGGCSGFEYRFQLDNQKQDDDHIFADVVVVDESSMALLKGSEIDFVDELIGSDFKINNPNATMGCGCGTSFAITGL